MPLGTQLCPLGLFYAPWGSSACPPSIACTPFLYGRAPPPMCVQLGAILNPLGLKCALPPQAHVPPPSVRASFFICSRHLFIRMRPYFIHACPTSSVRAPLPSRRHSSGNSTCPYGSRSCPPPPPQSRAVWSPCNLMEAYILPSNVAATVDKVTLVLSCQRSTWR
jgi:hypothetical protein